MTTRGSAAYGEKPYQTITVKDFGAPANGTDDDSVAFNLAVTAAAAAGGGVITVPYGNYRLNSDVNVSASNIIFDMQGAKIKIAGSAATSRGFFFQGTTLSAPTLGSSAAIYAKSVSLSALGGLVSGGWLMFNKTTPSGGGAYRFLTKVGTISGSGPYTVPLTSALPIAFGTGDAGLELRCVSPISNVGIIGNCSMDATLSTATVQHCVEALYCVDSVFQGINGVSNDTGAVIWAPYGHGNFFSDCSAEASGSAAFDSLEIDGQTASQVGNLRTLMGSGFGIKLVASNYCTLNNLISEGCVTGRGIKLQSSLENTLTNLQAHAALAGNGVGVSVGSCRNNFFGIFANGNATSEGLWLSEQDNCDNKFYGVNANGNGTRDIFVGYTDLRNEFYGVTATTVFVNQTSANLTTKFFGLNGELFATGISTNTPVAQVYTTGQLKVGSATVDFLTQYAAAGSIISAANSATAPNANMTLARFSADTVATQWTFVKGRGTAAAGTIVNSGDVLGTVLFRGITGNTTISSAASITCEVDGTPGVSDMPGRILFNVAPDGSETLAEAMRISNDKTTKFSAGVGMPAPRTITGASDTVLATDYSLIANRAGTVTFTLPSAATYSGRILNLKTIQAQTVVSGSSDVVPLAGGAAGTAILAATAGKWATLQSNGTAWEIIASN